jgi:hypothetical protein
MPLARGVGRKESRCIRRRISKRLEVGFGVVVAPEPLKRWVWRWIDRVAWVNWRLRLHRPLARRLSILSNSEPASEDLARTLGTTGRRIGRETRRVRLDCRRRRGGLGSSYRRAQNLDGPTLSSIADTYGLVAGSTCPPCFPVPTAFGPMNAKAALAVVLSFCCGRKAMTGMVRKEANGLEERLWLSEPAERRRGKEEE